MKKILAALLLAGSANTLQADAIDDYVNAEMARERIPGVALAIVRHGELMRAQGYGFANIEHRVPVHPDTIFQSGSIGKQFAGHGRDAAGGGRQAAPRISRSARTCPTLPGGGRRSHYAISSRTHQVLPATPT